MEGEKKKERERIFDEKGVAAFVARFVEIREKNNVTQRQLASETGLSQSYIGRLERGKVNPTISVIFAVARAMEIEPEEFFKFKLLESK